MLGLHLVNYHDIFMKGTFMCKEVSLTRRVKQPGISNYNDRFPRVPCNTAAKQSLFDLITDPENILDVLTTLKHKVSAPVGIYEPIIQKAIDRGTLTLPSWHEKQFAGAVVLVVMQCNGWTKTGKKQRFSKGIFSSGEIYSR